jgi:hypothetical protein
MTIYGVVAGVGAGVAPSVGSPGAAGVGVPVGSVPVSQAPRTAAKLNIRAKPKIFVFIINSSFTNCGNKKFSPVEYDNLFVADF